MNDDTDIGGEPLSLDEAASAYARLQSAEPEGQPETEDEGAGNTEPDGEDAEGEEPEAEDAEGEPDEDGQAEDEEEAEPETERGRYVAHNGRVKLPDGTESTVADLIAGNLKERDYRQKTMGLADQRRQFEEQSSAFKQREQQIEQQTQYMADLIRSVVPAEPDPALLQSDPFKYMQDKAARDQWLQHLSYLDGQRQQAAQKAQEEANQRTQEKSRAEWESLLEKVPEFRDQKKVDAFVTDLKSYGPKYGYSPQELAQVALDHRHAIVMRKAMEWDKLQASKATVKKQVEGRPPIVKGGKRPSPADRRAARADDAVNRLRQSGSMADAIAAYTAIQSKG